MKLPGIDYNKRIEEALNHLKGGAMLVMSMPSAVRNSDVGHTYRQHSLLHYFLGFEEPECALFLNAGAADGPKAVAFVREKDPVLELWEGARVGVKDAPKKLAVEEAYAIGDLWEKLPALMKGAERLYYEFGLDPSTDQSVLAAVAKEKKLRGRHSYSHQLPIYDVRIVANKMRLVKSEPELARMRRAANITATAFDKVLKTVKPGMNERTVHGMLVGTFMEEGAEMEAYGSIVAGGANACCLHYHDNNSELKNGELLLIDAGCQFEYYASDVTRTFPIGKTFSAEQKAVYEVVLETQLHGIALGRAGDPMINIHAATCRKISEGLIDLGLLKGSVDEIVESGAFKKYFPHGTGHWIGMDVHDVGDYQLESGQPVKLEPGMVFTVEPGIYIDPTDESAPEAFKGIGIRIEDDILVTDGDPEVLTAAIPKQVSELENRI